MFCQINKMCFIIFKLTQFEEELNLKDLDLGETKLTKGMGDAC